MKQSEDLWCFESVTSCSLSSLSCTSFFTKSATNSTQAIISMSGKTNEMASKNLGHAQEPAVNQNSRKESRPIISRRRHMKKSPCHAATEEI